MRSLLEAEPATDERVLVRHRLLQRPPRHQAAVYALALGRAHGASEVDSRTGATPSPSSEGGHATGHAGQSGLLQVVVTRFSETVSPSWVQAHATEAGFVNFCLGPVGLAELIEEASSLTGQKEELQGGARGESERPWGKTRGCDGELASPDGRVFSSAPHGAARLAVQRTESLWRMFLAEHGDAAVGQAIYSSPNPVWQNQQERTLRGKEGPAARLGLLALPQKSCSHHLINWFALEQALAEAMRLGSPPFRLGKMPLEEKGLGGKGVGVAPVDALCDTLTTSINLLYEQLPLLRGPRHAVEAWCRLLGAAGRVVRILEGGR